MKHNFVGLVLICGKIIQQIILSVTIYLLKEMNKHKHSMSLIITNFIMIDMKFFKKSKEVAIMN